MAAAAASAAGGCAGCAKWQRRVGVGVGVVLVDPLGARGGSAPAVLVGLRKGSHGSGQWALPGGWLERGESLVGCALRELAEETGLAGGELLADARGARGRVLDVAPCANLEFGSLSVFVVAAMGPGRAAAVPPRVTEPDKCLAWRWLAMDGSAAEALRDLASAGAAAGVAGEPQLFAPLEHLLREAREALQRETRRWLGDVQGR
jgi:8-oxo-dGTP diphosphatase